VCSVGTGGTIAGVASYLKQQSAEVQVVLLDCIGSALHNFITTGVATLSEGTSITEGIGNSRITENLAGAGIDWALRVSDQDMVDMVYRLLHEEGLFLGSSSGVNVYGAVEVARKLGPGHTVVTMLCDSGDKYQSSLYDRDWLIGKGMQVKH
jgi:cysteine synthase A